MTPSTAALARRVRALLPDPEPDGRYADPAAPFWLVLSKLLPASMKTRADLLKRLREACGEPFLAWLRAEVARMKERG